MVDNQPKIDWAGLIKKKELVGFKPVAFTAPADGFVSLIITDNEGNVVRHLLNCAFYTAGKHTVNWDHQTHQPQQGVFQMRKLLLLIALLSVANLVSAADAQGTRIYYLGNSLTDELKYGNFVKLAEAGGEKIVWGRQMSPGVPINGLWGLREGGGFAEHPYGAWGKALSEFQWDALTLQPFGNIFEPQFEAGVNFTRELMKKSPEATIYIYAQWPNRSGRDPMVQLDATDWDLRFAGRQLFYECPAWANVEKEYHYPAVVEQLPEPMKTEFRDRSLKHQYEAFVHGLNHRKATNRPVRLIPVGHVMQLLGQKMRAGLVAGYKTPFDFYSDGVHVNNDGSYLVALTFYSTIFKKSPVGLPVGEYQGKPGMGADSIMISPSLAKVFQETVWEVVSTHPLTGVTSNDPLKVASPLMDPAVAGEPYLFELIPAFGKTPYRWTLAKGTLPAGVTLSEQGVVSGVATTEGTSSLTITVTDAKGAAASKTFTFTVEKDIAPVIPAQKVPALTVGTFVDHRLTSEVGNGACRWAVAKDAALPPGLNLDQNGRLWGAPGKAGRYEVALTLTDGDSAKPESATGTIAIEVGPATGEIATARRLTAAPKYDPAPDPAEWDFRYPIKKLVQGDKASVSGAFDVAWDEKFLYVAVKITDATVTKGTWSDKLNWDNVIICLDGLNNREATYNADDRWIPYPRQMLYAQRSICVGNDWGMGCRQKELDGGYLALFQVSWNDLGIKTPMTAYNVIGLDLMIADDAKDGVPKSTVVWQGTKDNRTDPSKFGSVVLSDETHNPTK